MTFLILLIIGNIVILCIDFFIFLHINKKKINLEQQQKRKKQLEQSIDALHFQLDDQSKDYQVLCKLFNQKKKENEDIQKKIDFSNKILQEKEQNYTSLLTKVDKLKEEYNKYYHQQKQIVEEQLEEFKRISSKAAENYFNNLEKSYQSADAAHIQKMTRLKEEQDAAAANLNELKKTRQEVAKAIMKQAQIRQQADNYRLLPSQSDLQDIHSLERIKQTLHKPRILSMLIWQTYFQPIAKKQFPIILQDKTKMGIYRITNLKTDQFYIGQSVDIYKRWTDHCKAGLGIDTPVGNKFYKAMQEYGLENFAFEILCECSKEQLNDKERYFIELYQADLFGYNSQKGNK